MPFYARGPVRIHYEEVGSGFPLLLIPGGGLNSALSSWQTASPFNPMERYRNDFRCICADLRNANPGQSSGPLEIDRPWDAYTDDQLGLMDHLGIREFLVMGFCIGGPMIHNLIRRAPERVVAAAMMQPSGFRSEMPDLFYQNNIKGWGPALCERRRDVTMEMVHDFLTSMYTNRADFVFTVSRDFVRSIRTPLLIAPDDVPAHPYRVAMEVASLAPNAEVTIYPWKDSQEHIDEVVEHARRFLEAHEPDEVETLEALNRGYLLAAEKSDVAWYTEHLAEDYRATNPDGSFMDKAGFLARIGRPHTLTGFRAPEIRIQRVGGVALIHASFEDTRPDGSHGRGRYTDIWQRRNGRWLCVSAHFTRC